jgi:hypothetical protein
VQADAATAVAPIAKLLDRRGSLASSVYGEPRSTNDVDLVADLKDEHVDAFVRELGGAGRVGLRVASDAGVTDLLARARREAAEVTRRE